jgi:hypothetical protein
MLVASAALTKPIPVSAITARPRLAAAEDEIAAELILDGPFLFDGRAFDQ